MSFDITKYLDEATKPIPKMIRTRPWSADLAYERVKVIRDVKDKLREGINNYSIEMPEAVKEKYEQIYNDLRAVEQMEISTVKYGR